MSKAKPSTNGPPVSDILEAIDRERGQHTDVASQERFLRGLLVPKYTSNLNEDQIAEKATKLRNKISRIVRENTITWSTRFGRSRKGYNITELFKSGPVGVLEQKYLDDQDCELSDASDEESEASGDEDNQESHKRKATSQAIEPSLFKGLSDQGKRQKTSGTEDGSKLEILPPNPAETHLRSDKVWLTGSIDRLEKALWDTVMSYFIKKGIDAAARSEFVLVPPEELRKLYRCLVGHDRWEAWTVDEDGPHALRQDYLVMGLLGAAINKYALSPTPVWDAKLRIPEALGDDLKYCEKTLKAWGKDMKSFLRNVAAEQIADRGFKEANLGPFARDQAGGVIQILHRHLQQLVKNSQKQPREGPEYPKWHMLLEKAFQEAIIIKQTLDSSKLGPFRREWPAAGTRFDTKQHRPLFPVPGATQVLHTVLPSFWRELEDRDDIVFCKALVILSDPPTAPMTGENVGQGEREAPHAGC